jgi:regulator of protease activity HflC (stomatin/prohibitin superfamily)
MHALNTSLHSNDLNNLTVLDQSGRPLVVSAVVTWRVSEPRKALWGVQDYKQFLLTQSEVVLKQICAMYPYEAPSCAETQGGGGVSASASGKPSSKKPTSTECLKHETPAIRARMVGLLQARVVAAGLSIRDFSMNEICYAPSIAGMLLARQHAEAMLDARRTVVEGAVTIATEALKQLERNDVRMGKEEAHRLVANLVLTLCSESHVQHTMAIGGGGGKRSS